jgi:hypothetical protein
MLAIVPPPCSNQHEAEIKRLINRPEKTDRGAIVAGCVSDNRSEYVANGAVPAAITQMLNTRPIY